MDSGGKRSSNVELAVYLEQVYKTLEQAQQVDVIHTSYGKTFDHVDHDFFHNFLAVTPRLFLLTESC